MSTLASCSQKITELVELLDTESAALKKGQLTGLEDLQVSKAKGVADLEIMMSALPDHQNILSIAPQIQTLKRRADENGINIKQISKDITSEVEEAKKGFNKMIDKNTSEFKNNNVFAQILFSLKA